MSISRSRIKVVLLILLIAAVPMPVSAADQVIGSPEISVYSPDNELKPGERSSLPVYISNTGDLRQGGPAEYVDRVTTARGMTIEVIDDDVPIVVNTGIYPVGRVPQGTTGPLPISVTVPEDVRPGTYEIPVRVKFSYTSLVDYSLNTPEYNDGFRNRIYELTVEVRDIPRFEVVDYFSTTRISGQGNTSITVRNVGTEPARDVTVELTSSSDEIRFGTDSKSSQAFANTWMPGANRTFEFTTAVTADAATREYPLTAVVSYKDENGIRSTSGEMAAGITPKKEQTFGISGLSTSLYVGEPGTIRGTIINTGPITVDNAALIYKSSNPNIDPVDTETSLGRLESGESTEFVFEANVAEQASATDQQLTLTVRYRDQSNKRQVSESLEPTVPVRPERQWLAVSPEKTTVTIDEENRIVIGVRNVESVDLHEIRARISTEEPFTTESRIAYLPELKAGHSETLAFEVTVSEGAVPTRASISLNVTAKRPDGEEIVLDTYVVPVTVAEDTGASNTTILVAGGLIATVVLLAGWWWLRRR